MTDGEIFLDSVGGGAWPFLVGGLICLFNYDNERDDHETIVDLNESLNFNFFLRLMEIKPSETIAITGL